MPAGSLFWQDRLTLRQGFDEPAHHIALGHLVFPCFRVMHQVERLRGNHDYHVEFIQQDDQLSAVS